MGDTAEPAAAVGESFESNTTAAPARSRRASARVPTRGNADAVGWAGSEAATLICAVSVAVALGITCGVWVNARLTSAASIVPPAPAHLLPESRAAGPTTVAPSGGAETVPDNSQEPTPTAVEETAVHDSDEPSEAQRANPSAVADKTASRLAAGPATTVAREASPPEKSSGARGGAPGAEATPKAGRGQGRVAPCSLYASAGSLAIRNGGAATLVLGGPGEAGRIAVTTPDWSDIAVLSEGRTGVNGWMRYSVRSVSKRAGVYTIHFKTPCGSQTIPVTVARP